MYAPRSPRSPSPERIRPSGQGAIEKRLRDRELKAFRAEDPLVLEKQREWDERVQMTYEDHDRERWLGWNDWEPRPK